MNKRRPRFEQNIGWIILTLLLGGCLLVLLPFFSALLWAVVLTAASWPLHRRLVKLCRGRRTVAAAIMATAMICVVLIPLVIVGTTLASNVKDVTNATQEWIDSGPPAPPAWLAKVPMVGQKATDYWQTVAADSSKLFETAKQFIDPVSSWMLRAGIGLGHGLAELGLSIFIAFFLFRDGAAMAERLGNAVNRIGGDRGTHLLDVAAKTMRGVVYGILGTALVQAMMAGTGFLIAGVPGAGFLGMLTFFLSIVPGGPMMIGLPAALWLFHQGSTGWAVFMVIWTMGVSSVDNFIRPWLISQGSRMPFLLIFFGVLGGALAFGFIGIFIGPTLLAVGYRVIDEWASIRRADANILEQEKHEANGTSKLSPAPDPGNA